MHVARSKRNGTGMHHRSRVIHRWRGGLNVDWAACGDLVSNPMGVDGDARWQLWWVLVWGSIGLGLGCNRGEGCSDGRENGRWWTLRLCWRLRGVFGVPTINALRRRLFNNGSLDNFRSQLGRCRVLCCWGRNDGENRWCGNGTGFNSENIVKRFFRLCGGWR